MIPAFGEGTGILTDVGNLVTCLILSASGLVLTVNNVNSSNYSRAYKNS